MTPTEASTIIGCSPQQVRTLIRTGTLKARKTQRRKDRNGNWQYSYSISESEAQRYAEKPQTKGFPRGQSRKGSKTKGK